MKRQVVVCVCALASFLISNDADSAIAAPIVITTFDNPIDAGLHNQGWWSNSNSNTNTANISTSTGASTQFGMLRGYFTFYLPQLPHQVVGATLTLDDRGASLSTTDDLERPN
jgi:hypothetical protein